MADESTAAVGPEDTADGHHGGDHDPQRAPPVGQPQDHEPDGYAAGQQHGHRRRDEAGHLSETEGVELSGNMAGRVGQHRPGEGDGDPVGHGQDRRGDDAGDPAADGESEDGVRDAQNHPGERQPQAVEGRRGRRSRQ